MSAANNARSGRNIFETFLKLFGGSSSESSNDSKSNSVTPASFSPNSPSLDKIIEENPEIIEELNQLSDQEFLESSRESATNPYFKSFYSSAELDLALSSLPSDRISNAKHRCAQLRYPPALAILMEREKAACQEPLNNPGRRNKPRTHLEIHAGHFEGTIVKLFNDEQSSSDQVATEPSGPDLDAVKECTTAPSTVNSDHDYSERSTIPNTQQMQTDELPAFLNGDNWDDDDDDDDLQILSVEGVPDSIPPVGLARPTKPLTGSRKRKPSTRPSSVSSARSSDMGELSFIDNQQNFNSLPSVSNPPHKPRSSLSWSKALSLANANAYKRKCVEGATYLEVFYQHLIGLGVPPKIASEMTPMAVSSDFLVTSPCLFGRPHVICMESNQTKSFVLMGDALRMILLAVHNMSSEHSDTINYLTDLCRENRRSISLKDIRLRTQDGLQCVYHSWLTLFSSKNFANLHWLPVIPIFSLDLIMQIFDALATHFTRIRSTLRNPSWTSACSAVDLADFVVSLCPNFTIPSPISEPVTPIEPSTGSLNSPILARVLRAFLCRLSSTNVSHPSVFLESLGSMPTSLVSPLKILIRMTSPRIRTLYKHLDSRDVTGLAGIGLMCLLFKRLFAHFFLNRAKVNDSRLLTIRSGLQLLECPVEDALYGCDTFTFLRKIHTRVSECLKGLRTAYPQIVSAGACLTAQHRLRFYNPENTKLEDVGRSRLFNTPQEAREMILRMFKEIIYPPLVALLENVTSMHEFIAFVLARDLYMFKKENANTDRMDGNMAFLLLKRGVTALHQLTYDNVSNNLKQSADSIDLHYLLESTTIYKSKLAILRPPGLLYLIEQMGIQLAAFRHCLMTTRQHLSTSWWSAFTTNAADGSADTNVKLFVAEMQCIYDTIEAWSRGLHNVEIRGVAIRMQELLSSEMKNSVPGIELLKIAPSEAEFLKVPFGSKNLAETSLIPAAVAIKSLPPYPQQIFIIDRHSVTASRPSVSMGLLENVLSFCEDGDDISEFQQVPSMGAMSNTTNNNVVINLSDDDEPIISNLEPPVKKSKIKLHWCDPLKMKDADAIAEMVRKAREIVNQPTSFNNSTQLANASQSVVTGESTSKTLPQSLIRRTVINPLRNQPVVLSKNPSGIVQPRQPINGKVINLNKDGRMILKPMKPAVQSTTSTGSVPAQEDSSVEQKKKTLEETQTPIPNQNDTNRVTPLEPREDVENTVADAPLSVRNQETIEGPSTIPPSVEATAELGPEVNSNPPSQSDEEGALTTETVMPIEASDSPQRISPKKVVINVGGDGAEVTRTMDPVVVTKVEEDDIKPEEPFDTTSPTMDRRELGRLKRKQKMLSHQP